MTDTLISLAIWVAFLVIFFLVSRFLGKKFGWRAPARPQPPSLAEIAAGEIDGEALRAPRVFRRRHFIQTLVFLALGVAILVSFFATLASEGWGLLSLLLVVAEIVLVFAHGTPLLLSMSRTLTISDEGFAVRELVSRRSMHWWEIRRFLVAEDLSRFRAEGLHHQFTYETSGFPPDTKREIYRTLRAHLEKHQLPLDAWNQGPALVRFVRGHALGLAALGVIVAAAVIAESELQVEDPALGFKCATASKYLREHHDLPDVPGCVVLRVNLETNAHKAGLQEGDMIVALEGTPITSAEQLTRYFLSLNKKGDDFSVIRAAETKRRSIKARPGSPGRIPDVASQAAYAHYLRAQDGFGSRGAIEEYTAAIELAPEFDLAYVQRGKAYAEQYADEQAAADLDKALELDPRLAEAHRERASLDLYRDNDVTLADLREAMALDGCETGFKDYNYDCYLDHVLAANAYGGSGETDDYERAVAEAIEAITFYPEMANAYYLAAYYLWELGREDEARDYAATYVEIAEKSEEQAYYIEWAKLVVSGTNAFAERAQQLEDYRASTPAEAFITESSEDDLVPDGPPAVTFVTFAEERTFEKPPGQLSATFDRPRVWAYFEFEDAADVEGLSWAWTQNGFGYGGGSQKWPGANKGEAWIQLENQLPGEPSQAVLTIWLDGEEVATATLHIGDDAYVGPLRFYRDAEARQPVLFFDGHPGLLYAKVRYAALPVGTQLPWTAERSGVSLTSGSFEVNDSAQTVFPIAIPQGLEPGVIDVFVFLGSQVARKGVLVVSPADIASAPPFTSFAPGSGYDYEDGIYPTGAREFSAKEGLLGYVIDGASLAPGSVLSVRWTKDGKPLRPDAEEIRPEDLYDGYYEGYPFAFGGAATPGEYQVIVSIGGQPVYGDVIVIE